PPRVVGAAGARAADGRDAVTRVCVRPVATQPVAPGAGLDDDASGAAVQIGEVARDEVVVDRVPTVVALHPDPGMRVSGRAVSDQAVAARAVLASVLSDSALASVEVDPGEVAGRPIAAGNAVAEIEEEQAVVAVARDGVAENSRAAECSDRDPRVPVSVRVVSRDPDEIGAVAGIHPPAVVIQAVSDHGAPGRGEDGDALARVPADPVSFDPRPGGVVDVDSADLEGGNVVGDDIVSDGRSRRFEEDDARADVAFPAPGADPAHDQLAEHVPAGAEEVDACGPEFGDSAV